MKTEVLTTNFLDHAVDLYDNVPSDEQFPEPVSSKRSIAGGPKNACLMSFFHDSYADSPVRCHR
jgi:hypothetical protein